MHWIRGYLRLSLTGITLAFLCTLIILASFLPVTIGRYRLSFWLLTFAGRALLWILGVRVRCDDPDRLRNHHGFLFPNHVTYLDILALLAITPTRFLAKAQIKSWPVVGLAATAVGCVFVKRSDKQSRAQARQAIARAERYPPITLFPEGKRGPGGKLLPFRYGAFEIAIQEQISYLPCVIVYDRLQIAIWRRGEPVLKAVWRLATRSGPVQVTLAPLTAVLPALDDDPAALSIAAQTQMQAVLDAQEAQQAADR